MITLVNRNSASASEIVSGALQDHDRSLIVGETTFGKALVQSVYKVSQQAGAAITTARYYTPSGRLIQRPWDGTFDDYLQYRYREQDPNKAHKADELKYTDSGRKVYSGGGVEPDERFDGPIEGFNPSRFARTLYGRDLFDVYALRFARSGDTRSRRAPTRTSWPQVYDVDRRDGRRVQRDGDEGALSSGMRRRGRRPGLHQGDDSPRDRRRCVWRRVGVLEPARSATRSSSSR
jgi:hypothetical protein